MNIIKKILKGFIDNISSNRIKLFIIDVRYYLESDLNYRKRIFKQTYNRDLNIERPKTFNEKIHIRTLIQHDALFTKLADKIRVREYVANKIGNKYLLRSYGYYDNIEQINFDELPNKFVLKCNHDSGSIYLCEDKNKLNIKSLKKHFDFFTKRNLYKISREWQYKDIKPKIMCEEFIDIFSRDEDSQPEDYKIHCFNGKPKYLEIQFNRFDKERKINIYDINWNKLPVKMGFDNTNHHIEKPELLNELLLLSEKLSDSIDYCRVDFYIIENKIFFGEITFTPCNGLDIFEPEKWDEKFGEDWLLPK